MLEWQQGDKDVSIMEGARWNREWGLPPKETREQYISHSVEYTSSRYKQSIITSPCDYHVGGTSACSNAQGSKNIRTLKLMLS